MAEELGRSLEQLTATIQEQNRELKKQESLNELDKSITALEKSGTENSAQLRQTLDNIQIALDSASNAEQIELAEEQLEALKDLTGTEEENRESAKRQEEANDLLNKMVEGINGLADQYDKVADNLKGSGGLLAGLGAAALLFMDPETLFAGVQAAFDGVFAIVDSIKMFLEGDFTEGFDLLKENAIAVGAIIGTTALLFGGTIIRAVGSMLKAFGSLTKVLGKLFLPFTIITGLISFVTGFVEGYEEGGILGGIEAGLKSAFDTLIAWPLDLIKDGVAFVLGKLGFEDAKATLEAFSFSEQIDKIITAIFDMVEGAIDWVKTLFTDPKAALTTLWNGIVGEGGLVDMLFAPIDKAVAWVQGLFNWGDPDLPFDIREFVQLKAQAAVDWVKGLFTWASEGLSAGWTNLTDFISGKWTQVRAWFTNLLLFTSTAITDTWDGLTEFVSTKWTEVKTWFTGLFTWASDGLSEGWTNLTDFVKGKWTATKEWFTGMFSWSSSEEDKGVIQQLFDSTIEKVTSFFSELFDFLPSIDEIKALMTSLLPDWMQPDSVQEQRQSIEAEIANQQAEIADGDMRNWRGKLRSEIIEELRAELASLPQLNYGGIVSAPKSGTPVMLHGEEIVAPLNSPQGQVLMAINDLMNAKAAAGAGEYSSAAGLGAMIIQGGTTSNTSANVSTSSYNIQSGITPDDFLKRDFVNFSY